MRCGVVMLAAIALLAGSLRQGSGARWAVPQAERPHLVAMATCKIAACVKRTYSKIHKPEIVARIVYFSRLLALDRKDAKAALGLLQNIPQTEGENRQMILLATVMYPGETNKDIDAVGQTYWHFSRNLALALRMHPELLPAFVQYGTIALTPHSTYPNWAAKVCRSNPERFLKAFRTLSPKDRRYIAKYVVQPEGCKQIAFPEAN